MASVLTADGWADTQTGEPAAGRRSGPRGQVDLETVAAELGLSGEETAALIAARAPGMVTEDFAGAWWLPADAARHLRRIMAPIDENGRAAEHVETEDQAGGRRDDR